jgi:hypothetical protein
MGQIDGPLGGLVVIKLVTLIFGATVGGVLYQAEIVHVLNRLVSKVSPPTRPPAGPPIERIACDARRLRIQLLAIAPGIPIARRIGLQQAYDDVLVDACAALEVASTLTALPLGAERDAERLYVEHQLDAAACVFMSEPVEPRELGRSRSTPIRSASVQCVLADIDDYASIHAWWRNPSASISSSRRKEADSPPAEHQRRVGRVGAFVGARHCSCVASQSES